MNDLAGEIALADVGERMIKRYCCNWSESSEAGQVVRAAIRSALKFVEKSPKPSEDMAETLCRKACLFVLEMQANLNPLAIQQEVGLGKHMRIQIDRNLHPDCAEIYKAFAEKHPMSDWSWSSVIWNPAEDEFEARHQESFFKYGRSSKYHWPVFGLEHLTKNYMRNPFLHCAEIEVILCKAMVREVLIDHVGACKMTAYALADDLSFFGPRHSPSWDEALPYRFRFWDYAPQNFIHTNLLYSIRLVRKRITLRRWLRSFAAAAVGIAIGVSSNWWTGLIAWAFCSLALKPIDREKLRRVSSGRQKIKDQLDGLFKVELLLRNCGTSPKQVHCEFQSLIRSGVSVAPLLISLLELAIRRDDDSWMTLDDLGNTKSFNSDDVFRWDEDDWNAQPEH